MIEIAIESFVITFSSILVFISIELIGLIIMGLIAIIFGKKVEEDKEDKFKWYYQDEKCFNFVYNTDNSYKQVCISKDKLKSLIEDKNIDLFYENESK